MQKEQALQSGMCGFASGASLAGWGLHLDFPCTEPVSPAIRGDSPGNVVGIA